MMMQGGEPVTWVWRLCEVDSTKDKRKKLGTLFTFWWQVWKERNRRIFKGKELSIPQLSAIFNDQILLFQTANLPFSGMT
jgi:hypothetical protein